MIEQEAAIKHRPVMAGSAVDGRYVFPGCHMNKALRISALPDDDISLEDIKILIDLSYAAMAPQKPDGR